MYGRFTGHGFWQSKRPRWHQRAAERGEPAARLACIAVDQRQLLCVGPAFELTFPLDGCLLGPGPLVINKTNGPATRGPQSTVTLVVGFNAALQIGGVADL